MKRILLIPFMCLCLSAFSQTSIFQDASGESAFKLFGTAVTVNTKAESIEGSVDLLRRNPNTDRFQRWGINLKLASNEGLANIKGEDGLFVDGTLGIYRGWKKVSPAVAPPGSAGWMRERFVALNGGVDQNKFFNSTLSSDDLIFNQSDFTWKFELGQFGYHGNFLYGVGTSVKRQTNIGDLQTKTLRMLNYALYNDSALIYSEKKAFDQAEFTGSNHVFSLNADGAWLLNRVLASTAGSNVPPVYGALHFRYSVAEGSVGKLNPGFGIYLGQPDNPLSVLGGFNVQFIDLFNGADAETSVWNRTAISIVVGFKLGN